MNQKALFQIEKQILENKIKKRQEIITDLVIYNHQYKEDVILIYNNKLRLMEEKRLFIDRGKSVNNNVVRVITRHSIIIIIQDKIQSLHCNILNNWNRLDISENEHNKTIENEKICYTSRF